MRALLLALLLLGCATGESVTAESADATTWRFSHDVALGYEQCINLVSTSPDVAFRCVPAADLTDRCDDAGQLEVAVWSRNNAGEGQPFGVASFVEMEECQ
jgi:hypothetical protein